MIRLGGADGQKGTGSKSEETADLSGADGEHRPGVQSAARPGSRVQQTFAESGYRLQGYY